MAYALRIDWQEEYKNNPEKWNNKGRSLIEEACTHKTQEIREQETNMRYSGSCDECEFSEDSAQPMMNFLYPLETEPSDEAILEVVRETNCSVMENTETGEHFIVLCGGGMNLSQDLALAYIILEKWVPYELAITVSTQEGLTQSGKNWVRLKKAMQESLQFYVLNSTQKYKDWVAV